MKVALVHDYLNEFGGAERVLEALSEIWPNAPIYTAFYRKESGAYERFKKKKIITSWAQNVPFFASKLHSPLRFLAPLVWGIFDFSKYDVVISSSSWYVTKGFKKVASYQKPETSKPIEICYCHTPPRYLYGYKTAVEWQRYLPIRIYALLVNHFMRVYDFESAQKVDYFIANSQEVARRIKKFYRRKSKVIFPPVDTKKFTVHSPQSTANKKTKNYFLTVSRLSAAKRIDLAVEVCAKLGLPLKVVGVGKQLGDLKGIVNKYDKGDCVEFLGQVSDKELVELYEGARAVIFPAEQEDFGLVPVETMAAGAPVITLAQGGVLETVIDAIPAGKGKGTGVYFDPPTVGSLTLAINNFVNLEKKGYFDSKFIQEHAQKFSKDNFKREIKKFVNSKLNI